MAQHGNPYHNDQLPARAIRQSIFDPAVQGGGPPLWGQDFLPHIFTVSGRQGITSRSYLNQDEALRDSVQNAQRMRADCGIMECIEARQRATALLNWHIEPDDPKSHEQVQLAAEVTDLLQSPVFPRFTEVRRYLMESIWYGRYGAAMSFGNRQVKGKWRKHVRKCEPRNGDKLVFRYDDGSFLYDPDEIGIRVSTAWKGARTYLHPITGEPVQKVTATEQGLVYWLDPQERRTMIVHKHMVEDGPWEDPRMAGRIHGVGIRDRIYWTWYAMIECLQRVVEYLDRAAFGVEIWPYMEGNPNSKKDAENAAKGAMGGGRTVILAPLPPGEDSEKYMPRIMEPGLGGVNTTIDIIRTYFGHKIKRYILGQTLTSEADATGMGSGVADAHMATFADIVSYDATNLEETLTTDLVEVLQHLNFPNSKHIQLRFRIDTEAPNVQQKMQAYKSAWDMGLGIKAQEVADVIGASMPDINDEVLRNPQIAMAMAGGGQPPMGAPGQPMPGQGPALLDPERMVQDTLRNLATAA